MRARRHSTSPRVFACSNRRPPRVVSVRASAWADPSFAMAPWRARGGLTIIDGTADGVPARLRRARKRGFNMPGKHRDGVDSRSIEIDGVIPLPLAHSWRDADVVCATNE